MHVILLYLLAQWKAVYLGCLVFIISTYFQISLSHQNKIVLVSLPLIKNVKMFQKRRSVFCTDALVEEPFLVP